MTRFQLRAAALLSTVITASCFAACEQMTSDSAPEPATVDASLSPQTSQPAPPVSFVDHPLVLDTQHARIFDDQAAADLRVGPSLARQWNLEQSKIRPQLADGGTAYPNWVVATTTPVKGSAAIYAQSFSSPSANDLMFFGITGSGTISTGVVGCTSCTTNNFIALKNLHVASNLGPNLAWSASISGGTSASPAFSATGAQVYVLSDSGTLYCFESATGANCTGDGGTWSSPSITIKSGGAVTPWVDQASNNAVYVNDGLGDIYRFNASTGAQVWEYNYTSSGSTALPVETGLVIFVGDGAGVLYRIVDPGTGSAPTSGNVQSITLSGKNSNCSGSTAIDGSVAIDTRQGLVFLPWGACAYSFPQNPTGTWAVTSSGYTASAPVTPLPQTWPTLDGDYVYWVVPGIPTGSTTVSSVWKATYAFASPIKGTPLYNASASKQGASSTSAPLVYGGDLFVGDQSGYIEEFGCASSKSSSVSFLAETNAQGGTVNTPVVLDDATGNIEFGFTNGTAGGVAQFPLWESSPASNFDWNCPPGYVACDNQQCGTGPTSTECVVAGNCNTGACTTLAAAGATIQLGATTGEGQVVVGTIDGGPAICPSGTVIQGVLGASYGTPPATPDDPISGNTFDFASSCFATESLEVTEANCPSNTSAACVCPNAANGGVNCVPDGGVGTFVAENNTFGDVCVGTGKHFYGWFACAPQEVDGGTLPVFCSRQNLYPPDGGTGDPCSANPDGGSLATCQGTCVTGWGDCDNNLQTDGCETFLNGNDVSNCGRCGIQCTSAPANGTPACNAGTPSTCGFTCNTNYTACDGTCLANSDLLTDPNNCGSCGHACSIELPNCSGGSCTAGSSAVACSTVASVSGASIQAGEALSEGSTVINTTDGGVDICPTGTVIQAVVGASYGTPPTSDSTVSTTFSCEFGTNCYNTDSIATTEAECPENSQSCAFTASNGTFGDPCIGTTKHYYGWFVCAPETDASTSPTFCSRQNVVPPDGGVDPCGANPDGGPADCQGSCVTGTANCDGNLQTNGCETVINGVDVNNCGSCGNVCPTPSNGTAKCSAGVCGVNCNSGYTACNGSCLASGDLSNDSNNCGACGNICQGGAACISGKCSAPTTACSTVASVSGASIQVGSAPSEGSNVGSVADGGVICPTGTVVQAVLAASYGTPPAGDLTVSTSFTFGTCNDSDISGLTESTLTYTLAQCPLDTSQNCTFNSSNSNVGDPCPGIVKHYDAWFVCAPEQADAGGLPYYCSRQNVAVDGGTDPCITNPDGGPLYCGLGCAAGFGNCDSNMASNGCESDLNNDPYNCGECGNNCVALDAGIPYCNNGSCSATAPTL